MNQPVTQPSSTHSDKRKYRVFRTLDEALEEKRIPADNHWFITQLVASIDVKDISERSAYIHLTREDDGPDIHIHSGWTEGFSAPEEIINIHPSAEIHEYGTKSKRWYVVHPENRMRSNDTVTPTERSHGVCPVCFTQRAANGSCNCD